MRWTDWIKAAEAWEDFFVEVASCSADLEGELLRLQLVTAEDVAAAGRLRRSAGGAATEIPGQFLGSPEDLKQLALGFGLGGPGAPVVPFQALGAL